MTIYEKLSFIQNEMKVPKDKYNDFGRYYYRNAETILDVAKPICKKNKTTLLVSDEICLIGDRYYIKATASLHDWESESVIEAYALAREEENKKGMDASQITGATSSYARKYALNGLFNLDDVNDADSNEQKEEIKNRTQKQEQTATENQIKLLISFYPDSDKINALLNYYKLAKLEDMPEKLASKIIEAKTKELNNAN